MRVSQESDLATLREQLHKAQQQKNCTELQLRQRLDVTKQLEKQVALLKSEFTEVCIDLMDSIYNTDMLSVPH